jgi:DNA topoisomerase I
MSSLSNLGKSSRAAGAPSNKRGRETEDSEVVPPKVDEDAEDKADEEEDEDEDDGEDEDDNNDDDEDDDDDDEQMVPAPKSASSKAKPAPVSKSKASPKKAAAKTAKAPAKKAAPKASSKAAPKASPKAKASKAKAKKTPSPPKGKKKKPSSAHEMEEDEGDGSENEDNNEDDDDDNNEGDNDAELEDDDGSDDEEDGDNDDDGERDDDEGGEEGEGEEEEEEEETNPAVKSGVKKPKAAPKKAKPSISSGKAPAKKKVKTESGAAAAASGGVQKSRKTLTPFEKVERAMKSYKWWEAPTHSDGIKWEYIEHAGVLFPPEYEPHGVKMLYGEGEAKREITLTPAQEEIATMYAGIAKDGPQLGKPITAKVFNKNVWRDFSKRLGPGHEIQRFDLCDFEPIRAHLKVKQELKKNMTKEEKDAIKARKLTDSLIHGFAIVDGHLEKMGNYNVEPPGLFRGRGEHPKMGSLKKRVMPEDITINVAKMAVVPPCPLPGHSWKRVVHNPTVTWLAQWKDSVTGGSKFVYLAASSSFKGRSDLEKYEKARRLCKFITVIRATYEKLLLSKVELEMQTGTAMWIIDRLALRVGGEKDEDEADTVGCCSLRKEHLAFPDHRPDAEVAPGAAPGTFVTFDFLGKDSMRYFNTVDMSLYASGKQVWQNLKTLCKNKVLEEDVFDLLTPSKLNEQLNELMPGLSAKVFRTYNASKTLEEQLEELDPSDSVQTKMSEYHRANREVAILCNHQKTVTVKSEESIQKQRDKLELLKLQLNELKAMKDKLRTEGGGKKIRLKTDDDKLKVRATEIVKRINAEAAASGSAAPSSSRGPAKTEEQEITSKLKELKAEEAHLWQKIPTRDEVDKRITLWAEKVDKQDAEVRDRNDNKTVALSTSKINYMDPRITVAWCKRVELPIEKPFEQTLRNKFPWAMGAKSTFKFDPSS